MVNYKSITDTGPITFSPYMLRQQQGWLHGPTALPQATDKPPGSPPQSNPEPEQSPPSFFEPGNRIRWLLFFLPFIFNKYLFGQFWPYSLSEIQFCKFYLILFTGCLIITHLALNAKRKVLAGLPGQRHQLPYTNSRIKATFDKSSNTSIIPFLCFAIGLIKPDNPEQPHHIILVIAFAISFLAIYYTNNYYHTYNIIHNTPPYPPDDRHISLEGRNMMIQMGTLAITLLYVYDGMVDAGVFDGDND